MNQQVIAACTRAPSRNQLLALAAYARAVGLAAFENSQVLEFHDRGCFRCAANMLRKLGRTSEAELYTS